MYTSMLFKSRMLTGIIRHTPHSSQRVSSRARSDKLGQLFFEIAIIRLCLERSQLIRLICTRNGDRRCAKTQTDCFSIITKSTSCLHRLVPDPEIESMHNSRLRSHEKFPRVYTRTKRYCSFIQYALSHYQDRVNKTQRDRAAGCVIVFAKSRRLELRDNILRTL